MEQRQGSQLELDELGLGNDWTKNTGAGAKSRSNGMSHVHLKTQREGLPLGMKVSSCLNFGKELVTAKTEWHG